MKLIKNINLQSLKSGLSKTRKKIVNSITEAVTGKAVIDETTLDEIEEILLSADIGFNTTEEIVEKVRIKVLDQKERSGEVILDTVKLELIKVLDSNKIQNEESEVKSRPHVILVIGVNGVGKTTTIGKLANNFRQSGSSVLVGAADTFRAAANEQLAVWAERAGVEIVEREKGSDPASVAFDAVTIAKNKNIDVVIIDTAGRLHNKSNLMNELSKLKRSIGKVLPGAPQETLLVLDGTVGQNALIQANEFAKVTDISGLVITKLDGTAKGGAVIQICSDQKIPVKYIGVGEGINDLQDFEPRLFVDAIFSSS